MARLQFHDQLRVSDLTEPQLNALSALLSSPAAAPRPSTPLRPFLPTSASGSSSSSDLIPRDPPAVSADPIPSLLIEEDLLRQRRADIAHHRTIGTLTGRQHAMGLPVRGQRNKTNGRTAKRLNRIERRTYVTAAVPGPAPIGHGLVSRVARSYLRHAPKPSSNRAVLCSQVIFDAFASTGRGEIVACCPRETVSRLMVEISKPLKQTVKCQLRHGRSNAYFSYCQSGIHRMTKAHRFPERTLTPNYEAG